MFADDAIFDNDLIFNKCLWNVDDIISIVYKKFLHES